jgi:hypothetical protein
VPINAEYYQPMVVLPIRDIFDFESYILSFVAHKV